MLILTSLNIVKVKFCFLLLPVIVSNFCLFCFVFFLSFVRYCWPQGVSSEATNTDKMRAHLVGKRFAVRGSVEPWGQQNA